MLTVEMVRSFWVKGKTFDRSDLADMQSHDVLKYLNQAQDIKVDQLRESKQWGELRPIMDDAEVLAAAFVAAGTYDPGIAGAIVVNLAGLTSYRNYVRSQTKLSHSVAPTFTDQFSQNEEVDLTQRYKFETNGSNKPIFTKPVCWQEGDYLIVLPDAYSTISAEYIQYIKTPTTLVLTTPATDTCDLPDYIHEQIVDIAVQLAMLTVNINDAK